MRAASIRVASMVLALAALLLAACSAGRSGLGGPDGSAAPDLGGDAFGQPDLGVDGGGADMPLPPPDSGIDMPLPPTDLGIDMPPPPTDLGVDFGPVCTPGCATDMLSVISCGSGTPVATHCDRGCDAVTRDCRPAVACSFTTFATITTGAMTIDLCGQGADRDRTMTSSCSVSADGEDVVLRLEVDSMGHYTIDLDDSAGGHGVDPVVYVRTICDMSSSQLGCDDDGGPSTNSSLDIDLGPGEYFLVVDSIDNEVLGNGCGSVDLSVTRTP